MVLFCKEILVVYRNDNFFCFFPKSQDLIRSPQSFFIKSICSIFKYSARIFGMLEGQYSVILLTYNTRLLYVNLLISRFSRMVLLNPE